MPAVTRAGDSQLENLPIAVERCPPQAGTRVVPRGQLDSRPCVDESQVYYKEEIECLLTKSPQKLISPLKSGRY